MSVQTKGDAPRGDVSVAMLLILLTVAATICGMLQPVLAPLASPPQLASTHLKLPRNDEDLSSMEKATEGAMIGVAITVSNVVAFAVSTGVLMAFAPLGAPWSLLQPGPSLRDRLIGFLSGAVGGILMLMPRSGLFQALTACCMGSLAIVALAASLARVDLRRVHQRAAAMLSQGMLAVEPPRQSGSPSLGGTVDSR